MDIFGIGPLEILLVLLIALIVLGPNELVKTGKTIGRFLRKLVTSESWQTFQQASREIKTLPNKLMREAGLEEIEELEKEMRQTVGTVTPFSIKNDLNQTIRPQMNDIEKGLKAWTKPPDTISESQTEPDTSTQKAEQNDTDTTRNTE